MQDICIFKIQKHHEKHQPAYCNTHNGNDGHRQKNTKVFKHLRTDEYTFIEQRQIYSKIVSFCE